MKPLLRSVLRPLAAEARRRRFRRSLRPSDVFIVSFPKSGKTWLLYMLANLFRSRGGDDPLSIIEAHGVVPDVNREYGERSPLDFSHLSDPRFFAVHARCDLSLPNVVYLVRDPRDVLVSFWHYKRLTVEGFDVDLPSFVEAPGWSEDWRDHVEGWLESGHPSLLLLSYEELSTNPASALRRVVDFAGVDVSAAEIERAVRASSFERMREAEERYGFSIHSEPALAGERFVRKGVVGGWREELGGAACKAIERRYGALMRRLGYELSPEAGPV